MNSNWKVIVNNFLNKALIFNLYLFALGLLTSKALTSISGGFVCIFGLLQLATMKVNPFRIINDKFLNLSILFFAVALFLSFIEHPDAEAFSLILKHLVLFIFFYITVSNLHNLKQVKKLLLTASVSMGIAAVYGLFEHYILKTPRIEGFSFPLAFGCLLVIFIIFMLVYAFWGKFNTGCRIAILTGTAFLGANLLFTKARGAWLGLLGGIATLAWLKNKKLLIILVIFCLILYLFLPQTYTDRFKSSFDIKTDSSNLTRIALWKAAILMYRDHFINGVGLGRFSKEYETNYKQPYSISTSCHAHNNILQFMAEAGTFGLIGFIWLIAAIVMSLYKNYKLITNHNWRLFPLASLCGVIAFNIQGLTEVNYGDAETLRFFWFMIALNIVIIKLVKDEPSQSHQQLSAS